MFFKIEKLKAVSGSKLKILFRYLAEIVIIFIGITISFAFEQWREEQRQKDSLIELTKSLLNDTKIARTELSRDQPESAMWIARLDSIRTYAPQKNLSPQQLEWFYYLATGQFTFLFEAHSATFESASATSLWNQLPDTIRTKVYRVYNNKLQYASLLYDQQQENITHFRLGMLESDGLLLPAANPTDSGPDYAAFSNIITQKNWQNLANQAWITERKCYKQNEEAIAAMLELEKDLEMYLKQLRR
jgi:hypothetical protein